MNQRDKIRRRLVRGIELIRPPTASAHHTPDTKGVGPPHRRTLLQNLFSSRLRNLRISKVYTVDSPLGVAIGSRRCLVIVCL